MSGYDPQIHRRRSIRLKGYDYSRAGKYFVTICTDQRHCLFGEIVDGAMILNEVGSVAQHCWRGIPEHFPQVELDDFVVMPNHIHGIISIVDIGTENGYSVGMNFGDNREQCGVGAKNLSPLRGVPSGTSKTVGSIVRGFKIGVTKWVRQNTEIYAVWQRNYWEHIIRDEHSLNRIRNYIRHNPSRWEDDKLFMGH